MTRRGKQVRCKKTVKGNSAPGSFYRSNIRILRAYSRSLVSLPRLTFFTHFTLSIHAVGDRREPEVGLRRRE